jgi:hypothetical protein
MTVPLLRWFGTKDAVTGNLIQQRALPIPDHSESAGCRSEKLRGAVNGVTNSMLPKTKPALMAAAEATVASLTYADTLCSG